MIPMYEPIIASPKYLYLHGIFTGGYSSQFHVASYNTMDGHASGESERARER